jgi:hypothetical protein
LSRSPFSRSSLSSFCRPCRSHRSIDLIHFARCNAPDKTLVKPVPDFYVRKTKTSESIIIRSTIRYGYNNECCERVRPVSEVAGPDISFSTVFQHHKLDNYGTVRVPTLFSELVQRTLAAGQLSTHLFGYRPCCRQVAKPTTQGLTSMKCACHAADFRCPTSDLSMIKQVTLSSSCNLDHAQTVS